MDSSQLRQMVEHENETWNEIFKKELSSANSKKDEKFSSEWWRDYYCAISKYINERLSVYQSPSILEAGAGSGKASILLGKKVKRTLLDISPAALEYARYLAVKFKVNNIDYITGNIFQLPFPNDSFEFVWNIGVAEHYDPEAIVVMLSEMMRVCKSGGQVAIAVPNFFSLPMLKARVLGLPLLRFIPGYRLDSEKFYSESQVIAMFHNVARQSNVTIETFDTARFGNPLFMEVPGFILHSVGHILELIAPKTKFLTLYICSINKRP